MEMPFAETLIWYEARDAYLGMNKTSVDMDRAIELANGCHHPDAKWLCEFHNRVAKGFCKWNISDLDPTNGRDLFFLYRIKGKTQLAWLHATSFAGSPTALLHAAAIVGYPAAQSRYASRLFKTSVMSGVETIEWIEKAAAQADPKGLYLRATLVPGSNSVALNLEAAQLGFCKAQYDRSFSLNFHDKEYWVWAIKAMGKGLGRSMVLKNLQYMMDPSRVEESEKEFPYHIGHQLANIERRHGPLRREKYETRASLAHCQKMMTYYRQCVGGARSAVDTWTMWAVRTRCVNHDVRKLISRLVWDQRQDWLDRPFILKLK